VNRLYFGDNLKVLHERAADETVELIHVAPLFNGSAT
jgi:hypothetical protein